MSSNQNILIVDDEAQIRALLMRAMSREGYAVRFAVDGEEAFGLIEKKIPDLILLDFNLPGLSGKEICRRLRRDSSTMSIPIIMITGSSVEELPADCLNSGADDYVPKPFNIKELLARVKAILRRPRVYQEPDSPVRKGIISILPEERSVVIDGAPAAHFTPKEFELLRLLVTHSPRVLDKNTLCLKVWGQTEEFVNDRTLDVHIRRIRAKLGTRAATHLVTVPSSGFQWRD